MPVYREIDADLETPVSAYLKVARPPYSFLLESVEGGERLARYSFIGTEPYAVRKTGPGHPEGAMDPLIAVEREMNRYKLIPIPELPRFHGGAVGYLAYDVIRYFRAQSARTARRTRWHCLNLCLCSSTPCWSSITCSITLK